MRMSPPPEQFDLPAIQLHMEALRRHDDPHQPQALPPGYFYEIEKNGLAGLTMVGHNWKADGIEPGDGLLYIDKDQLAVVTVHEKSKHNNRLLILNVHQVFSFDETGQLRQTTEGPLAEYLDGREMRAMGTNCFIIPGLEPRSRKIDWPVDPLEDPSMPDLPNFGDQSTWYNKAA